MTQSADKILDHFDLFREPEYKEMLEAKRKNFENPLPAEEVERVREWTKTADYREKNFAREGLTVNPAKACQPLGAVFAAVGFERTLPFVHGSQGCVAYYRSHFSRHFKEPCSCVSSSMTEDAAVFGGLNNMVDGLANAYALYKPKMIAVSTTCMAEVIGDDLNAFIKTSKEKGSVPQEFDVPFAHTPAFVGSHVTGYDNVMKGILEHFWSGKAGTVPALERIPNEKIDFIGGFDGYAVGDLREIKRIFKLMQVERTILATTATPATPTDGEFRMYDGGTTLTEAAEAVHAKATVSDRGTHRPSARSARRARPARPAHAAPDCSTAAADRRSPGPSRQRRPSRSRRTAWCRKVVGRFAAASASRGSPGRRERAFPEGPPLQALARQERVNILPGVPPTFSGADAPPALPAKPAIAAPGLPPLAARRARHRPTPNLFMGSKRARVCRRVRRSRTIPPRPCRRRRTL